MPPANTHTDDPARRVEHPGHMGVPAYMLNAYLSDKPGTLSFSTAILDAAALGFLGMGAQPPTPEWGTMLAGAREFILSAWWVATFPGFAILLTVLAINLIGDGLRDVTDPGLRRS